MKHQWIAVLVALCVYAGTAPGQSAKKQGSKSASLTSAPPATGATLFRAHCASCHGVRGVGDGPVAGALNLKPSDLTRLNQRNGGHFPAFRIEQMLGGSIEIPVHGTKSMPVWGPALAQSEPVASSQKIRLLIDYLQSLQAPANK